MEKTDMIAYSEALFSCSVPRRMVMACPLAFGEVGVKERIKTVLNYKKPAFWIIIVAVVACATVAVCFLTNPKDDGNDLSLLNYENLVSLAAQSDRLSAHLSDESGTYEYSVKGNGLAQFLDAAKWTHQRGILRSVQRDAEKSKASIQIDMYDGICLRVFDSDTAYIYDGTIGNGRYYRMKDGDYSIISNLTGDATLSLNDVLTLSGKGADLTWSDFDAYSYTETGSGLYIRVYEIDEHFSLWIGGGSTDESPMYIHLKSKANSDDYIDIRTENVEEFIASHRGVEGDTYMYSVTVYMNPLSSYMPAGTTGYLYRIDDNGSLTIVNEETDEIFASVASPGADWSPLTAEEWEALFVTGDAPDISGIHEPRVMRLSDRYYLFDMDGGLWLGEYNGDKNGMWSVYELALYHPKQSPAS